MCSLACVRVCEFARIRAFMAQSDVLLSCEQLLKTFTCAQVLCTHDNIYMSSVPTESQWKLAVF